jgi:hypothetical protein
MPHLIGQLNIGYISQKVSAGKIGVHVRDAGWWREDGYSLSLLECVVLLMARMV